MTCFCLATTHDRRGGRWCTPLVQRVCHGTTSGPLPARRAPLASSHPMSSQNAPCLPPLASLCLRLHSLPRPGNMPNTPHRTAPHLPCSPDEMICTRPPICRGRSAAPPARSLSLNFGGGTHIMGPAARARGAAGAAFTALPRNALGARPPGAMEKAEADATKAARAATVFIAYIVAREPCPCGRCHRDQK